MLAKLSIADEVSAARPARLNKLEDSLRAAQQEAGRARDEVARATADLVEGEGAVRSGAQPNMPGRTDLVELSRRRDLAITRQREAVAACRPAMQEFEAARAAFLPRFRAVTGPHLHRAGDLIAEAVRLLDEADAVLHALENDAHRYSFSPRKVIEVDKFERAAAFRVVRALARELVK